MQKGFALEAALGRVRERPDRRERRCAPRIETGRGVRAVMVMGLLRLGSLHGLEQLRARRGWRGLIGGALPSARTIGRVMEGLEAGDLRAVLQTVYTRRKRNKALPGFAAGQIALLLDGHECSASFRRSCPECLRRTIHTATGDRTQFYHRLVAATLLCGRGERVLLDVEMQRPGEDEVACARRLFARLVERYRRAFTVVVVDGLYARADFFQAVVAAGKDVMAVLKDERRELMADARGLFATMPPRRLQRGMTACECWDVEGFTSWTGMDQPVRVVRSLERLAAGGAANVSEWMWVTTLPCARLSTEALVAFGHGRWAIENEGGFNTLVNDWHADHLYRHPVEAMTAFWLVMMLVVNLFGAFLRGSLKAVYRARHTARYWATALAVSFYQRIDRPEPLVPP